MKKNIPAISIVIPMYNAEKFIGECLDSILAQTFDDYEVIIVDDCSTDESAAVVESYIPKFTKKSVEKLQLVRSNVNSGGAGTPRKIGLQIAIGEYIFFMNSDDAITATALNELYKAAEQSSADIVHCDKFYRAPDDTVTTDKALLTEEMFERASAVEEPTFMSEELAERIKELYEHKFVIFPWNQLIRRNFIFENNLEYPDLRCGDDFVFGFYTLCLAKKILRVPNVCYVWRRSSNSVTFEKQPVDKLIHRWTDSFFRGVELMDKFMNRFELFNKHPEYRHMVFELPTHYHLSHVMPVYAQIPAPQLEGLIRRELAGVEDKTALTAYLFAQRNVFYLRVLQLQQQIQQLRQPQQQFQLNTEDIFK